MTTVKCYRDLQVYQLAFDLAVEVDALSKKLPRHELYEEGSQIRRCAKSIPGNIAEGYGRRRYTQEFVRFLVIALASCDETQVHLDLLEATGSAAPDLCQPLRDRYETLGRMLNRFLQSVSRNHQEPYR